MNHTLELHLQEGFENDVVVIRAAGTEVLRLKDVSTKLLTGHAGRFEIDIPTSSRDIEISVPSRRYSRRIGLQLPDKPYVGVSVGRDGIEVQTSSEPFGYM